MPILPRLAAALLCAALLHSGAARADTLYQIELIVFARDGADATAEEGWPGDYNLRYPGDTVILQPTADGSAAPYQLLPPAQLQLQGESAAIARRRNLHVLFHGAWQEPGQDPAHATSVFIAGGQLVGTHHELEGYVTLSVERYLHLDTHLWLSRFTSADQAPANAPLLPAPPTAATTPDAVAGPGAAVASPYAVSRLYVLEEQRRMRSGELHYEDHPALGLLVLVTPVATPAAPAPAPAASAQ